MLNYVRCYTFINLHLIEDARTVSVVHVNDLIEDLRVVFDCLQEIDTIMISRPIYSDFSSSVQFIINMINNILSFDAFVMFL